MLESPRIDEKKPVDVGFLVFFLTLGPSFLAAGKRVPIGIGTPMGSGTGTGSGIGTGKWDMYMEVGHRIARSAVLLARPAAARPDAASSTSSLI